MSRRLRFTYAALFLFFLAPDNPARAQVDLTQIIGVPANAHTLPIRFGFVNLDNGNLHLEIPLYSLPERGHSAQTNTLVYDSTFWNYWPLSGGPEENLYPTTAGWGGGGQFYTDEVGGGAVATLSSTLSCSQYISGALQGSIYIYTSFQSTSPNNTTRTFSFYNNPIADARCYYTANSGYPEGTAYPGNNNPTVPGGAQNGTAFANDGSGYKLIVTKANNYESTSIIAPSGTSGVTPNGNLFDITSGLVDELGSSYPASTGTTWIGSFYNSTSDYIAYQPYVAKSPVTGTISRPVWDNATQLLSQAPYQYTWEYIPVCTGSVLWNSGSMSTDYCGGMWVLGSVTLPDGGMYSFGYDEGASPVHLGKLTSITLPTGGVISYGYGSLKCGSVLCGGQVTSVADNGGTTTIAYSNNETVSGIGTYGPWTYYPVTVTYPPHVVSAGGTSMVQDQTIYSATTNTFTKTEYSGSSAAVRTTTTTVDAYGRPSAAKAVWNATGESHEVDYKYADDPSVSGTMTYGELGINMVALAAEYTSGSLVRSLQITYLQDTSTNKYVSQYNMINYPSVVKLMSASGSVVSQVQYTYDEYSASYCSPMLASITGAAGHDDTDYGVGYTARGNPTTITYSGVNLSSPVVTHRCYDTLGNVLQTIDGNGNATQFSYADIFYENKCLQAGLPTYAFPTTVTDALGHRTVTSYYSCNRAPRSVQGPNDLANGRSGTVYTYDTAFRPSCVTAPDGGQACDFYRSLTETDVTTLTNSQGTSNTIQAFVDAFGRAITTINEGSGAEIDTTFDVFGRVNSVSNAHYGQASSSDGITSFAYDALGRQTGQKAPDGSIQKWTFTGNTVLFTDAVGNQWQTTSDSLGRLTKVLEPSGVSTAPSMETDYTSYDALNNLQTVTQCGGPCPSSNPVGRSFTYDGLSRLVSATNPESGTIGYSYDGVGNVITKTSPAVNATSGTQTLGFCYDQLNRMTFKFYSGTFSCSSPSGYAASYSYDSSTIAGAANDIGMLTDEKSYVGGTLVAERSPYIYDAMGRILNEQQCTLATCSIAAYLPAYIYDLAGNLLTTTDGTTSIPTSPGTKLTFTNTPDSAGRLVMVASNWSDGAHPQTLFSTQASQTPPCPNSSSTPYAAFGGLMNAMFGNGLTLSRAYDNRLRTTCEIDMGTGATAATSGSATVTITGTEQSK